MTLIQRFGSALNLNLHFHMLFLDGAYVDSAHGLSTRFRWVLGLWIADNEWAKFWLSVFTELKARGREEAGEVLERFGEKWDGRYPARELQ